MNYYLVRNSLSNQYRFTVLMMLNDISAAVNLIKLNCSQSDGELIEFMYVTRGERNILNNITDFNIFNPEYTRMLDCAINSLYSQNYIYKKIFYNNFSNISKIFYLSDNSFDFYYFVAALVLTFESLYDDKIDLKYYFNDEQIKELIKSATDFKNIINIKN